MRPRRIHWIAGSLLTAGVLMLVASQAAGGSPAPATLPAGGDHHDYPDKSPTPEHSATPKHSATPGDTATPKHSPTPEDTATPEPSPDPSPTIDPTATSTPRPYNPPPPTKTAVPPTVTRVAQIAAATSVPPTPTPMVPLPPKSGDGGLLAQHRAGIAVLGFLLVVLSVGLIAARGAVDAKRT